MTHTNSKPDGMSWVIPYLTVKDAEASMNYYQDKLGFKVLNHMKDDEGVVLHGEVQYKDIVIMFGNAAKYDATAKTPEQMECPSPVTLYCYCEDVDSLYKDFQQRGVELLSEPEDQFWGDRMFRVSDIDGHLWTFSQFKGQGA